MRLFGLSTESEREDADDGSETITSHEAANSRLNTESRGDLGSPELDETDAEAAVEVEVAPRQVESAENNPVVADDDNEDPQSMYRLPENDTDILSELKDLCSTINKTVDGHVFHAYCNICGANSTARGSKGTADRFFADFHSFQKHYDRKHELKLSVEEIWTACGKRFLSKHEVTDLVDGKASIEEVGSAEASEVRGDDGVVQAPSFLTHRMEIEPKSKTRPGFSQHSRTPSMSKTPIDDADMPSSRKRKRLGGSAKTPSKRATRGETTPGSKRKASLTASSEATTVRDAMSGMDDDSESEIVIRSTPPRLTSLGD